MYALDSGPFRGVIDGVGGLLSGLLSGYSAHFYGGRMGLEGGRVGRIWW